MRHNFRHIFITISILLIFGHCKNDENYGKLLLTEEAKEFFPYEGGEQIVFVDSLGDDIPYTIDKPEIRTIHEVSYSREELIVDTLGLHLTFTNPANPPIKMLFSINFKLWDHPEITAGMQGNWIVETGKIYSCNDEISSTAHFCDSLTIVNKKFYKVYELSAVNLPSWEAYQTLYYTIEEGVIGFKTNIGRRWRID